MHDYSLVFPDDFDDYEWEVTAKGCFSEVFLTVTGICYRLSFYDATRLRQEIDSALDSGQMFFEPNVLVIKKVDKEQMEKAAELLVRSGQVSLLLPT
ncbi:hypothetical protein SAMN03097694_2324 [Janthinobacterium lividum]|uniref:Uncharacterized protein n=1 Tax=Janthinobacterium lividum TaxID=29581 RepID=A0AB38C7D2_9BURK|nr:hypothetical protein [Janthinobacterium lividum]SFX46658.1 hypothetical protein SAMN03097694_2324 [Janthinobacterium lividum]